MLYLVNLLLCFFKKNKLNFILQCMLHLQMHSIHYLVLKQVKFLRWSLGSELNGIFCDLFEFIIASTIHMQVVLVVFPEGFSV